LALKEGLSPYRTRHRIHLLEGIQSRTEDTAMKVLCHTYGKTFLSQDSPSDILGISFLGAPLKETLNAILKD